MNDDTSPLTQQAETCHRLIFATSTLLLLHSIHVFYADFQQVGWVWEKCVYESECQVAELEKLAWRQTHLCAFITGAGRAIKYANQLAATR